MTYRMAYFMAVMWIYIGFNKDPDPGSQTDEHPDPDPGQTAVTKILF